MGIQVGAVGVGRGGNFPFPFLSQERTAHMYSTAHVQHMSHAGSTAHIHMHAVVSPSASWRQSDAHHLLKCKLVMCGRPPHPTGNCCRVEHSATTRLCSAVAAARLVDSAASSARRMMCRMRPRFWVIQVYSADSCTSDPSSVIHSGRGACMQRQSARESALWAHGNSTWNPACMQHCGLGGTCLAS